MAGACSDCVRCSIRHRRAGDLGPEHAGPRSISTGHSPSAYVAPVYRGPPVIFTFSRWPGGPRVLAGRGSTTLAARASFLFTFHAGLLQLFCDFNPDGTCLAGVRRVICVSPVPCRSFANTTTGLPLTRLCEPYGLRSLSTVLLTIQRHTFCLKRDCGINQPPKFIDIDLD